MLAIVEALEWWKVYLLEAKHQTIIKSDHKNLQYFMTTKKLNKWQAQWAKILVEYDFIIQYCKEKNNSWTDILNRKSDFIKKTEWMTSMISENSSRIWFYHSILQEKKQ